METSSEINLSSEDHHYLCEIVEAIKAGFDLWTDEVYKRTIHDDIEGGIDYRKLFPQSLKQALICIQRIKPEILTAAKINSKELVRSELEEFLDSNSDLMKGLGEESHEAGYCLTELIPFALWFEEESLWKARSIIQAGRCESRRCSCSCLKAVVPYVESTLIPATEQFAFEEDPYKENEFRHLYR